MSFLSAIFFYATVLFPNSTCVDSADYQRKIQEALISFNIQDPVKEEVFYESCDLVSIGKDIYGREQFLDSKAAESFFEMKKAAEKDSIDLQFVSAFRSFNSQKKIIEKKLSKGYLIEKILKENKLPGYSEHHTGKAIDFTSRKLNTLSTQFENSKEFKWIVKNASIYNFYLSYPKDNKEGIMYEPWHWMFKNND